MHYEFTNISLPISAPVMETTVMQIIVALSVTKDELIVVKRNAQDLMYANRLLEPMELQVRPTMILEMDKKEPCIVKNYSVEELKGNFRQDSTCYESSRRKENLL